MNLATETDRVAARIVLQQPVGNIALMAKYWAGNEKVVGLGMKAAMMLKVPPTRNSFLALEEKCLGV